jgi:anti-anti-sigma regulatory factor
VSDAWQVFVLQNESETTLDMTLLEFLKQNTQAAVRIDAGAVRRLDTRLLELLIVAARTWRKAELPFEVQGLGESSLRWLDRLGISTDTLMGRAQA